MPIAEVFVLSGIGAEPRALRRLVSVAVIYRRSGGFGGGGGRCRRRWCRFDGEAGLGKAWVRGEAEADAEALAVE